MNSNKGWLLHVPECDSWVRAARNSSSSDSRDGRPEVVEETSSGGGESVLVLKWSVCVTMGALSIKWMAQRQSQLEQLHL